MLDLCGMTVHHYAFLVALIGIICGYVFCLGLSK
jgi:hypothetical protein